MASKKSSGMRLRKHFVPIACERVSLFTAEWTRKILYSGLTGRQNSIYVAFVWVMAVALHLSRTLLLIFRSFIGTPFPRHSCTGDSIEAVYWQNFAANFPNRCYLLSVLNFIFMVYLCYFFTLVINRCFAHSCCGA